MEVLLYAFNAVVPLLLLIALGYFLKQRSKWSPKFFSDLNNFCYRILLPIQLFNNVYGIKEFSEINWKVLIYTIAWVPLIILIGTLLAHFLIKDTRQKGAFVQAGFRSNQAIMGLPLAISLGGNEAAAIASLATSVGIPLFNIGGIIVLKLYDKENNGESKLRGILKSLVTNPLIFEGNELHLNFETSAYGYIIVDVLDEDGNKLSEGQSFEVFGNNIDRRVMFEDGSGFAAYAGKAVRLRFRMRDAKIYSMKFEN